MTCTLEQCAEGNIVPKRRDIKGEWGKCNEELHDLYPSPNIIIIIKYL
jgi:hypothetical protein